MEQFGSIREGVNVNIQRSDGRIHAAIVTQLHPATKSVSVEWSERNETKGKEIELEAIIALNQHLFNTRNNRIAMGGGAAPSDNGVYNGHHGDSYGMNGGGGGGGGGGGAANRQRGQPANTNRQSQVPPTSQQAAPPQTSRNTMVPSDIYSSAAAAAVDIDDRRATNSNHSKAKQSDDMRRKSNVVKEIERIKKNREQRRANQEEKRQKLNEIDTSVPAWEFANMIAEFRATLDFTRITQSELVQDLRICVCVRKRPINKKELAKKDIDVITMPNKDVCLVHLPKLKVDLTKYLDNQKFRFDYAFDETINNDLVYKYTAQPLVNTIFQGGNAMCFAYGQTGSGKTFTMGGDFSQKNADCSKGIYALTAKDVFKQIGGKYKGNLDVYCTFFEIYCGKVFDLLNNKKKLRVLEDHKNQVQVVDLREQPLNTPEDVLNCIQYGMNIRTSGTTSANQHSSRSHAVFQIILRNKARKEHGKISLIDLAGSERGKDTSSSDRITRMEGAEINKSLLALKECIRALGRRDAHVPFRGSTLTKVLRDSFIGDNSRVCMIAMISPGNSDVEHTLNTLRYADRVKELGHDESSQMNNDDDYRMHRYNHEGITDEDYDDDDLEDLQDQEFDDECGGIDGGVSGSGVGGGSGGGIDRSQHIAMMNDLQETLAELQDMEEQVLETHTDLIRDNHRWMTEYEKIYEETIKVVDYDREEYAKRLDAVINQNLSVLNNLQRKLVAFKEGLIKEEKISKNIQHPKLRGGGGGGGKH